MNDVQIKKLQSYIQADPLFRVLKQAARETGEEAYLVGGLVRDWMLGRRSRDVDLTLPHKALITARRFSEKTGGTLVLLREEEETARVVLPGWTFDFTKFKGADLNEDLKARDFTVNAIALSLPHAFEEGGWSPFDPLGGLRDLQDRILRMAGPDGFSRDPLRLLRAFRLTAQHGLILEAGTRQAIQTGAPLLTRSAPERIHYEWNLLLSQADSTVSLKDMDKAGLLAVLFPELESLKGIQQAEGHSLDVFQHSLLTLQYLEKLLQSDLGLPQDLERDLRTYLKNPNHRTALKWAALFHDLGKIDTAVERKGQMTFYGHEAFSQKRFALLAQRFRLSNQEKDSIGRLIGWHRRPFSLVQEEQKETLSRRTLVRFIKDSGEALSGIFLLAVADSLAAPGEAKGVDQETLLKKIWSQTLLLREEGAWYLVKKAPLLSGRDLLEQGLKPGPLFKKILSSVEEDFLVGEISTREEALERAIKYSTGGEA